MKKLFTNLLLAILINGFTSATPTTPVSLVEDSNISKAYVSASYETIQKDEDFEIDPLDLLAFKFK
jgi:3'-phosphoadenosine 5'-phosphosulfate (PAPS) 3'-phosphatase